MGVLEQVEENLVQRARIAAAAVHGRARELATRTLCWELPHHVPDAVAAALVDEYDIATFAIKGEDNDSYYSHIEAAVDRLAGW